MHPSLREIGLLQARRGRNPGDLSIAGTIENTAGDATRVHRRMGELIELWQELLPEQVAAHTALSGFRQGVLHVIVDSAATSFEVDRLLRSGLEGELRRRFRGSLTRVRTRIGPLDGETPERQSFAKPRQQKTNGRAPARRR